MDLVGGHRRRVRIAGRSSCHPVVIGPLMDRWVPHARRRLRANLHREGEGIGLEAQLPVPPEDLELVELADADVGHEELPDAAGAQRAHRQQATVPAIEVANDTDAARVRRPDREADALGPLVRPGMSAEHVVQPLMRPLADEVEVDLADRRPEAIWVIALPGIPVREREPHAVSELPGLEVGHDPGPQAVPGGLHRRQAAVGGDEPRGVGVRMEGADDGSRGTGMRAEDRMRVVMLATREAQALLGHRTQLDCAGSHGATIAARRAE